MSVILKYTFTYVHAINRSVLGDGNEMYMGKV